MTSALDLAGVLRSAPTDDLLRRLSARQLRPSTVHDAFDLADSLLEPASVRDVLSRLDRTELRLLQAAREPADTATLAERLASPADDALSPVETAVAHLLDLFLLVPSTDGRIVATPDAVGERLDDDPLLSAERLADERPPVVLEAVDDIDREAVDARSSERLYAIVIEVAEILRALEQSPARELAKGGLALPETRRLAEAARIDVDDVSTLLGITTRAGLARTSPDGWVVTAEANAWLASSWPDRWEALTSSWLDSLPLEIVAVLRQRVETSWGEPLREFTLWSYPAGAAWVPERLAAFSRSAELLGLSSGGVPTSAALALFREGAGAARSRVAELLPEAVEQVYLQHDLTVVSPGPLSPALDARLRVIAVVESAGLAATYRITEGGVQRALSEGETADTLRAFLAEISATGIPQPLDYLVQQSAERHGRYRVSGVEPGTPGFPADAVTLVEADEHTSIDTLEVDHALSPLALRRLDGLRIVSRFERDTVFWALSDERYPVVVLDETGISVTPPVRRRPRRPVPAPARDQLREMVERLSAENEGSTETTDRAWIARQLDAAVKGRLTVTISIEQPDGTTSSLEMEPTGVGGGRLRGRDKKSDVERTLPLSHVVAVSSSR
ncbi:helicase-associated domain-containing protein [Frigoribacterium sp. CFBP 13712]|uniref:helicase-associated domain-containing protein n=1 Tax=Frigoribacterium sp. CFBP 13712 TaxID=2775309 RepID=UPI00177AD496|nr:helicase-associated domain-containing protein [Frigoribacterium sp. CFBP 13712]MBD8704524.1 helicase-associated domain-containing protein [Frigoribacterium sp. CFBP 13712]